MATDLDDLSDVPLTPDTRLEASAFRLAWVDDWYDGPLAGMIERGGERLYLALHDRGVVASDAPWRWVVLRLTPAAQAEQEQQHALFAHHVGEHWCMHEAPHPAIEGARSPSYFYQQQATRPPLTRADGEVIGWLDESPPPARRRAPG